MCLDAPVNVGWGKKETQFHGSLGKEAAKINKEVNKCMCFFPTTPSPL